MANRRFHPPSTTATMDASRQCMRSSRALAKTFSTPTCREVTLPAFLVPAFAQGQQTSRFSTSSQCQSKIGIKALAFPPEVKFTVTAPPPQRSNARASRTQEQTRVDIEGPLGRMSMTIPPYMSITVNENGTRQLHIRDKEDKKQKAMWGTTRAYLQNHILGVSEGHAAILRLVGVGYRASIEEKEEAIVGSKTVKREFPGQKLVSLKVGYSHPIELLVPEGLKASTPQPTRILLEGVEKEVVKQFAAEIRAWRVPEPYKGKGIFVNDETIRLKAKKIK
ncbi:54S ribosomal protein L6, mitochondrial [Fulvia fulva]|uniref:54S ribosomal protein L6, mitochondrial n=1 Tax=Passalora fulva TaxID=5499 RepID=A0A9Q8L5F7_PASFU|nr:54S ribosomal protein L6, mitochondrial [Fulvia fulva]KAK4635296.1 54S ribosomal protein L6, mitochondrial [Fulvia fulva]KAK4636455.1 54S ribosomal protein L6, mitochondrial [Fulvia fulva]UJO11178.1 54S ribosomal protein L6, mitochondrial [Fulvia fulva]WPV09681.1 54S ribosomal protein L6, mitochondrial [Fulvia fulva]WPV23734.1 54S ribosomal protein L6, mitochondrial [Fulvia fulva]